MARTRSKSKKGGKRKAGRKLAASRFTDRERLFIKEYLVDFNGARAARDAGYEPDNARHAAYELLTKHHIIAEINRELEKRTKKLDLTIDFTIGKLKALARSNIRNVAAWADGQLHIHDSASLTEDETYQIESLSMKQTLKGPEIKIKMRPPQSALELLARHQNLLDIGDQTKTPEELENAIKTLDDEEKGGKA